MIPDESYGSAGGGPEPHLTAEQMMQLLTSLAKHNTNLAQARELKWGV